MDIILPLNSYQTLLQKIVMDRIGANTPLALFTNDFTPTKNSVFADFDEANFAGYSRAGQQTGDQRPYYISQLGCAASLGQQLVFEATGTGNLPQTLYGWFMPNEDDSDKVKLSGRFDEPITLGSIGDGLQVSTDFFLNQSGGSLGAITLVAKAQ